MEQRVAEFISNVKTRDYRSVLVVTSGWVIQAAIAIIKNISNEEAWELDIQQATYLKFEI